MRTQQADTHARTRLSLQIVSVQRQCSLLSGSIKVMQACPNWRNPACMRVSPCKLVVCRSRRSTSSDLAFRASRLQYPLPNLCPWGVKRTDSSWATSARVDFSGARAHCLRRHLKTFHLIGSGYQEVMAQDRGMLRFV